MKDYKEWTAAERNASFAKTKKAIKEGIIPAAERCERCGQDKGVIDYHNHDYSDPIAFLEALCFRCHMVHHREQKQFYEAALYWRDVYAGKTFEPIHKREFGEINKMFAEYSKELKGDG